MHDSRGAALKVGDRVLIEAVVTELSTGGDENYCCVDVTVVTPDQPGKEKVMSPPHFSALSTRMLTKIGAAIMLLLALTFPLAAQESIEDKIARLEANNAQIQAQLSGIAVTQARIKSDITDLRDDLKALNDKLDALAKAVAPNAKFAASQQDVWGRGAPATFTGLPAARAVTMQTMQFAQPQYMMRAAGGGSCGRGG